MNSDYDADFRSPKLSIPFFPPERLGLEIITGLSLMTPKGLGQNDDALLLLYQPAFDLYNQTVCPPILSHVTNLVYKHMETLLQICLPKTLRVFIT